MGSYSLSFLYQKILTELSYFRNIKTIKELKEENLELRKIILKKELTNLDKKQLINENTRLKEMLELKEDYPLKLIAATITNTTPWEWNKKIRINKGSKEGIKKESLVIDTQNNLVGKIISVSSDYSMLKSVSDPNFKIRVSCKELKTIFAGSLFEGGRLLYVPHNAQISEGDTVSVNNINGKEINIRVGKINVVYTKPNALTKTVFVKPFINLADVNKVFVINK